MTKEIAEYMVKLLAQSQGYKFDNEHYFEYLGTWISTLDNKESHVFLYHEPIPVSKDGIPLPIGEPRYWISNDNCTRPMYEWMDYEPK